MKGFFQYTIFLIYMGSLAIAFSFSHSFVVMKLGWAVFLPVALMGGPVFIAFHIGKEHPGLAIAGLHLILAIIVHPEISKGESIMLEVSEQHQLLNTTHDRKIDWWNRSDAAYDLALSLRTDAEDRYALLHGFWYWVYPPSLALVLWGVVIFFFFPKDEESGDL